MPKKCTIREVHFKQELPSPVTAIIYGEFSSELEINFHRKIYNN